MNLLVSSVNASCKIDSIVFASSFATKTRTEDIEIMYHMEWRLRIVPRIDNSLLTEDQPQNTEPDKVSVGKQGEDREGKKIREIGGVCGC